MVYLIIKIIIGIVLFIFISNLIMKRVNNSYNLKLVELLKNNYLGWHYDYIMENLHKLFLLVDKVDERDSVIFLRTKSANNKTMIIFQFHKSLCSGFFIQSREAKFKFCFSSDLNSDLNYKLSKKMFGEIFISEDYIKKSKHYDVNNYLTKKFFYNNNEPNLYLTNPNSYLFIRYDLFFESQDNRYITFYFNQFINPEYISFLLGLTPEYINSMNDYIIKINNELLIPEY
jgi:hypothetical protein